MADPRPHDTQANVRTVIQPGESSLYVVNADGTQGRWWCPEVKRIGGLLSVAWSADSSSLAVLSSTPNLGFHSIKSFVDICTANGTKRVTEIPNSAQTIGWINNGRELATISTSNSVLTPEHVWTVPAGGGTAVDRYADLMPLPLRSKWIRMGGHGFS